MRLFWLSRRANHWRPVLPFRCCAWNNAHLTYGLMQPVSAGKTSRAFRVMPAQFTQLQSACRRTPHYKSTNHWMVHIFQLKTHRLSAGSIADSTPVPRNRLLPLSCLNASRLAEKFHTTGDISLHPCRKFVLRNTLFNAFCSFENFSDQGRRHA